MIKLESYLEEKRNEIIWALAHQHFTNAQIGRIFNRDRGTIADILKKKPRDWQTKWIKK